MVILDREDYSLFINEQETKDFIEKNIGKIKEEYPQLYLLSFIFERFFSQSAYYDFNLFLNLDYMIKKDIIHFEKIEFSIKEFDLTKVIDEVILTDCFKYKQLQYLSRHDKNKIYVGGLLAKKGGNPKPEVGVIYGKADVYCSKLNIAVECGFTPIERLIQGIKELNEFWVYPTFPIEFDDYMRLNKEEKEKYTNREKEVIYVFKKGKNWEILVQRQKELEKQ